VIAYKKYFLPGKSFQVFCTGDAELIDDCQSRLRGCPNERINQFADRVKSIQAVDYSRHGSVLVNLSPLKLRKCIETE